MATPRGLGLKLLGAWLVLSGVVQFTGAIFPGLGLLLGALAFAAGLLILVGR